MGYEVSVDVDAGAEAVWEVLTQVERWPEWTPSVTRVARLDAGPFGVGSRARIEQPRLPPVVWTVTEIEPQRSFAWSARGAGVTTVADHRLAARPGAGVTVTLSIRRTGLLAPLVDLLFAGLTRRYVGMEAAGLKRRCESAAPLRAA